MTTEAAEIAVSIEAAYGPIHNGAVKSFDDALKYVRSEMPEESETVINNVAWELDCLRRALNVAKLNEG